MSEKLIASRHPDYNETLLGKYRLVFEGGQDFIEKALQRYSHEIDSAWLDRRKLAYNPAFAEEAVSEYSQAILQYQNDVVRIGKCDEYLSYCRGENHGVDGQGSSMNSFIGRYVIDELLAMGKIGIYVDNHQFMGTTLADTVGHPYMYTYKAEDILNWSFQAGHPDQLRAVLLRETVESIDSDTQLPDGTKTQYRHLYLDKDDKCHVDFYNDEGDILNAFTLDIKIIPFIFVQIGRSLLRNVCDYQAALLNLSSSTFNYAWGANFAFYIESYDPMYQERFTEKRRNDNPPDPESTNTPTSDAYSDALDTPTKPPNAEEIKVGPMSGRRYVKGLDAPQFINPSSEPMTASMSKEKQLKEEIRQLVALNISSLTPKMASAESKAIDREGLEGGLNFIGLTLELMERRSALIWHNYMGVCGETKIAYPESYTLLTDQDRRAMAKELKDVQFVVPSKTYQQTIAKRIAHVMFSGSATPEDLAKMDAEVEASKVSTADPEILKSDHEAGFVSTGTASIGRGYPEDEAAQAAKDHAERIARIKEAQEAGNADARGDEDGAQNQGDDAKKEKVDSQNKELNKEDD